MAYITICYIDGDPVVYEGIVSEEDRRKLEALFPESTISWEVRQVEGYLVQAQQMMAGVSEIIILMMVLGMLSAISGTMTRG